MKATGLEKGDLPALDSKEQLAAKAFDDAWKVALDTRFEGTDEIPNTVDRLKQIGRNFLSSGSSRCFYPLGAPKSTGASRTPERSSRESSVRVCHLACARWWSSCSSSANRNGLKRSAGVCPCFREQQFVELRSLLESNTLLENCEIDRSS